MVERPHQSRTFSELFLTFPNIFRTFPHISEDLLGGGAAPPTGERHPAVPNISRTGSEPFCKNHLPGERRGRGEGEALTSSEHVPNIFRTFPTASPRRPPILKNHHGPPNPFENRAALRQSTGSTTREVCQMLHHPTHRTTVDPTKLQGKLCLRRNGPRHRSRRCHGHHPVKRQREPHTRGLFAMRGVLVPSQYRGRLTQPG